MVAICRSALLDLSAAFDTVDHHILPTGTHSALMVLHRADCSRTWRARWNVSGTARRGPPHNSLDSVPEGSGLDPLLFVLCTASFIDVIKSHGLHLYLYADDTQIQGSCCPGSADRLQSTLSACLDDVTNWMQANQLQLNTSKMEILWCLTMWSQCLGWCLDALQYYSSFEPSDAQCQTRCSCLQLFLWSYRVLTMATWHLQGFLSTSATACSWFWMLPDRFIQHLDTSTSHH